MKDVAAFEKQDGKAKVAMLRSFIANEGLPDEEALFKVRLSYPFYYLDSDMRSELRFELPDPEADALLPYLLKDRVNRALTGGLITRELLGQFTSLNALVRGLIRFGEL